MKKILRAHRCFDSWLPIPTKIELEKTKDYRRVRIFIEDVNHAIKVKSDKRIASMSDDEFIEEEAMMLKCWHDVVFHHPEWSHEKERELQFGPELVTVGVSIKVPNPARAEARRRAA